MHFLHGEKAGIIVKKSSHNRFFATAKGLRPEFDDLADLTLPSSLI
jgi:hypothetical protein